MSDHDRPWEGVEDHRYFRRVMKNMEHLGGGPRAPGAAHVRFGRTGEGVAPNYQIEGLNGVKTLFNGLGHREITHVDDEFDPEKISETFTYAEVRDMLARVLGKPPAGVRGRANDEDQGPESK